MLTINELEILQFGIKLARYFPNISLDYAVYLVDPTHNMVVTSILKDLSFIPSYQDYSQFDNSTIKEFRLIPMTEHLSAWYLKENNTLYIKNSKNDYTV